MLGHLLSREESDVVLLKLRQIEQIEGILSRVQIVTCRICGVDWLIWKEGSGAGIGRKGARG